MAEKEIFLTVMSIFLVFNIIYIQINPTATNTMVIGGILGTLGAIIMTAVGIAILSGIKVLGSGVSDISVKIIFSFLVIMNILFRLDYDTFSIGMGLATNMMSTFSVGHDLLNFGVLLSSGLAIVAFISGMMIVVGSG